MKPTDTSDHWDSDFVVIALRFFAGELTEDEIHELNLRLEADPGLRELFVEIAAREESLFEESNELHDKRLRDEVLSAAKSIKSTPPPLTEVDSIQASKPMPTISWAVLSTWVALPVLVCALVYWLQTGSVSNDGIENGVWIAKINRNVGSDLEDYMSLTEGLFLDAGADIRFSKGIVEVRFQDDVLVTLNGPARMRVDGRKSATLLSGAVSVKAGPAGVGFKLDTPEAEVIDLGTEFSVQVMPQGETKVKVDKGEVELMTKRTSSKTFLMSQGDATRINHQGVANANIESDFDLNILTSTHPSHSFVATDDCFVIGGKYVDTNMQWQADRYNDICSGRDLLVKRDFVMKRFNRKAYLRFDFSNVAVEKIVAASLRLTVKPNDLAAEKEPEKHSERAEKFWKFSVSGVWDEQDRDWDENELTWNNAPGHDPVSVTGRIGGATAPIQIGEFVLTGQGRAGELIYIEGPKLAELLQHDKDGRITLIIERLTGDGLCGTNDHTVHGFADRESTDFTPPTLDLWTAERGD